MKPKKDEPGEKVLATNRLAFHNYHLADKVEAGMQLLGTEVKSLRAGGASLRDAYAREDRGEVFLHNCHIAPYSHGGYANHDPLRVRKLLLHRTEIERLMSRTRSGGATLVPLRLYLSKGRVKVELAVGRTKKQWDKRQAEKEHDQEREARAAVRDRGR